MKTFEDVIEKIRAYLKRDTLRPYFVISDDPQYFDLFQKSLSLDLIRISDFCNGDFLLDTDLFVERLNLLEKDSICFGLGEYIYFTDQKDLLLRLYDKSFNRKVIFICRGIARYLEDLAEKDRKFRAMNFSHLSGVAKFSVTKYNIESKTDAKNFSDFLKIAETGQESISLKTDLPLANVKEINFAFDVIQNHDPNLNLNRDALTLDQWQEYSIDDNCEGFPIEHWRTFARGFKQKFSNPYLQFVFDRSSNSEEYQRNLFFALLEVDDSKFDEFYRLRKKLVENLKSRYFYEYLKYLKDLSTDILKFLTDNTSEERRAMIRAIQGKSKIPNIFEKNFPAMKFYLADFDFGDETINQYFRRYKKIKLSNVDDENFKTLVEDFSTKRSYTKFDTRQTILDRLDKNSKLYWLDALGVEFASYIESRAKNLGIFVKIQIARANLPTLTSQNKNFFDDWTGDKFEKNQKLDDLKHSLAKDSTYIDEELQIIDAVIEEIRNFLVSHETQKVILTSDHGASRLAVIYGREKKYKMNSAGEHGGRCCLTNEIDEKPDCAIEEDGWWILTNYDRFSGSRLASVEVHGGATLEEILIPVIEFSLHEFFDEKISEPNNPAPAEEDDSFDFFN